MTVEETPPLPSMTCPNCGRLCQPYGGFGPAMPYTGKYHCEDWAGQGKGCGQGWYGNPSTGAIEERF